MIAKQKIKILIGVIIVIATYHFIVSSNVRSKDLSDLVDLGSLDKSTTENERPKNNIVTNNRLDNPPNEDIPHAEPDSPPQVPPKSGNKADFSIFFEGLEKFAIKQPGIKDKYTSEKAKEKFSTDDNFLFGKEYLENVLDIPQATFKELKDSHKRYVDEHIPKMLQRVKTFGSLAPSDKEWESYKGSSGYIIVGGGRFTWLSFLVIKQLRATGAKLPVEMFIATESDYEKEFCEKVLPKYNARCNVFDYKLADDLKKRFDIGGYQYKMLALLSSKFENVLYLDSDNFPTRNVDYLFESDLYKENNLLLWPDAWARTTNPKYYEIAGVPVKENKLRYSKYDEKQAGGKDKLKPLSEYTFKDSWYHDFEGTLPDPTSETGMFMVNKSSHLKTLLLCLYYNVFGPQYYYPLLTQGSAGEGDKETFIAAAHVMKEPWYQCARQFKWTGYVSKVDNKFTSKALAHYDPVQAQDTSRQDVDIIFMHLSYPKFYPNWLADNHDLVYANTDEHIRMYSSINKNVGYDFDLRVMQFFTEGLCPNYYDSKTGKPIENIPHIDYTNDYMGNHLMYVKDEEQNNIDRCNKVFIPHLKWLKETAEIPTVVS